MDQSSLVNVYIRSPILHLLNPMFKAFFLLTKSARDYLNNVSYVNTAWCQEACLVTQNKLLKLTLFWYSRKYFTKSELYSPHPSNFSGWRTTVCTVWTAFRLKSWYSIFAYSTRDLFCCTVSIIFTICKVFIEMLKSILAMKINC